MNYKSTFSKTERKGFKDNLNPGPQEYLVNLYETQGEGNNLFTQNITLYLKEKTDLIKKYLFINRVQFSLRRILKIIANIGRIRRKVLHLIVNSVILWNLLIVIHL
jgi:hypothetical protein